MPQLLTRLVTPLLLLAGWLAGAAQTALAFSLVGTLPAGERYGMGYCQAQRYFYLVGGGSPLTAYTRAVFRYDAQTNSWGGGPLSSWQVAPHRPAAPLHLQPAAAPQRGGHYLQQ